MVYQRYQVLLSTCTDGWYKIILNSGTGEPHGKKNLDSYFTPYTKINKKGIIDQNLGTKT